MKNIWNFLLVFVNCWIFYFVFFHEDKARTILGGDTVGLFRLCFLFIGAILFLGAYQQVKFILPEKFFATCKLVFAFSLCLVLFSNWVFFSPTLPYSYHIILFIFFSIAAVAILTTAIIASLYNAAKFYFRNSSDKMGLQVF